MTSAIVTVRVDCPVCEQSNAITIQVERYKGCPETGGDRPSPAEPASDDYCIPDSCPECCTEYTDEETTALRGSVAAAIDNIDHPADYAWEGW